MWMINNSVSIPYGTIKSMRVLAVNQNTYCFNSLWYD